MVYLRQDKTLIFISTGEIITYYTTLIDELIPKLQEITQDNYQVVRAEIAGLRQELRRHLKDFSPSQMNEYFTEAMEHAESEPELYALSNAYENLLTAQLRRIKEALYTLRTT